VRRYFTIAGRDPFDEVEWGALRVHPRQEKPAFDQKDVEFPKFWSQTARTSSPRSTSAADSSAGARAVA